MKLRVKLCMLMLLSCACYAQTSQPPATADEMQFLSFMLMNVGSIDHDQKAVAAYEDLLIKQFNLNAQESAFINAQGPALNALLNQLRTQSQAIVSGKQNLSAADAAALTALINQRQQYITTLANQILNAVRPETATRLRTPGHILAAAGIH
ncbi:MAG: hypothetical protein ACLQU1_37790 [Bryobacteraceae bacterium]